MTSGRAAHHHFFVDPAQIMNGAVSFSPAQEHQITRVLRLDQHDRVVVLDGLGGQFEVGLSVDGRAVRGEILGLACRCSEPSLSVTLYQAIIRPEHLTWLLQKGTELGVSRFVPVLAARGQHGGPPSAGREARLRAVLREAAEQSRRLIIPALGQTITFRAAVDHIAHALRASKTAHGFLLWEGEGPARLSGLRGSLGAGHTVCLLVGPEGGWSPQEVALAQASGLTTLSLGPRLLRAETAALAGAMGVLSLAGDLL